MRTMGPGLRRRAAGLALVALVAAAVGLVLRSGGELSRVEQISVDTRFSLRGRQAPPSRIVVVGIDANSVGRVSRWPFSRFVFARALTRLHAAGARLIVYDIAFDQPTAVPPGAPRFSPRQRATYNVLATAAAHAADDALGSAAQQAAPVVFATTEIMPSGATTVLGGNAALAGIGDQAAAADLEPDSDGVIRHMLAEVNHLPTIAAAVARLLDRRAVSSRLLSGAWIDFRGPPGTVQSLSFFNVLRGRFNPELVKGKVVVIGATAPVLQDLHATSVGAPMSGPEVQAEAISTALDGFPLRSPPDLTAVLLIVALALVVPVIGMRAGTLVSGLSGAGVLCLWSVAAQLAFDHGAVLDYSDPVAALLVATAGTVTLTSWSDREERRRLRRLFAANATTVVDQVLLHPGSGRLAATAIIAGYRIESVLGRGGMGVVYRATQIGLERTVAIKLIAAERSADPTFRERFKLESRAAAAIDHANVIPVYEAGEDDGLLFIAMRLVDGVDLAQLLARVRVLDAHRSVRIVEQLAGALDAAHARGLVHRDVKPANVLLTVEEPEHAYLTDFGVAKSVGDTGVTQTNQWVGTLDYIAPEQIAGGPSGPGVDIYALAGLLHHCLTGQTPYPLQNDAARLWAHLHEPAPRPSEIAHGLPVELNAVIARGMAKDAAGRYDTASDLARAAALALGIRSRLAPTGTPGPTAVTLIPPGAPTVVPVPPASD